MGLKFRHRKKIRKEIHMEKFKIGIIGAARPCGKELIRLLLQHPLSELVAVSSEGYQGRRLSELYPGIGIQDIIITTNEEVISQSDIVFCALDGDNQELAAASIKGKSVFIDLGTAFRLSDEEEYAQWYGGSFEYPGLHEAAIYGLPEILRDAMTGRVIIGCPGAVASGAILALAPAFSAGLLNNEGVTVNAVLPSAAFNAQGEGMLSLGVCGFRETAEIEQMLSEAAGASIRLTVIPQLVEAKRGMLVTCLAKGNLSASLRTLRNAYEKFYADEPFIRLLPNGTGASTNTVIGSEFCDISIHFDERTSTVAITAAMDYFMKGTAGNAIQCMNRIVSVPEGIGIDNFPVCFAD